MKTSPDQVQNAERSILTDEQVSFMFVWLHTHAPELLEMFGIQISVATVDTNIFMEDVWRYARSQRQNPTGLLISLRSSTVKVYTSAVVIAEMPRKLAEEPRQNLALNDLLDIWHTEYQPKLTVIDALDLPQNDHERKLSVQDPTDLPLLMLTRLLNADAALSENHKHLAPTFRIYNRENSWARVTTALRDKSFSDSTLIEIAFGGHILLIGASGLGAIAENVLQSLAPLVADLWQRIPMWAKLLGLVVLVVALSSPKIQRRGWELLGSLAKELTNLWDLVSPILLENMRRVDSAKTQRTKTQMFLEQQKPTLNKPSTVRECMALVLARSPLPLTDVQLLEQIKKVGYKPRKTGSVAYLRQVLRSHPTLFESAGAAAWHLRIVRT